MFNFNSYSGLLLIGCLQALIFAVILLLRWRRDERLHDLFAALILVIGGMYAAQWMLGFAGWYDNQDWRSTIMFYLEWSHLTALGPLIWLYFRAVTNTDFVWEKKHWLHFIPALIFTLPPIGAIFYDFIIHALLGGNAFEGFGGSRGPAMDMLNENSFFGVLDTIEDGISKLLLPIYLIFTLKEYRKYRDYVGKQFANGAEYFLPGLRFLLYTFLIGLALAFVSEIFALASGVEAYSDVWPQYFAISVLVYAAAIQFFRLDARQTRQLRFEPETETEPSDKEDLQEDLDRWILKLEKQLATHQDYLEPDLKLADLADRIGANTSVLSKVINAHYGLNFNDFINAKRCEAFMKRLQNGEHKQHTLLSLALDSGFNSKSTFNRAFKKHFGISPGQAVKELVSNHDLTRPKP